MSSRRIARNLQIPTNIENTYNKLRTFALFYLLILLLGTFVKMKGSFT